MSDDDQIRKFEIRKADGTTVLWQRVYVRTDETYGFVVKLGEEAFVIRDSPAPPTQAARSDHDDELDWGTPLDFNHSAIAGAAVTCPSHPAQIGGTLVDGRHFYFRYRDAYATLGVGATADAAVLDRGSVGVEYGVPGQGHLSVGECRILVTQLLGEHPSGV